MRNEILKIVSSTLLAAMILFIAACGGSSSVNRKEMSAGEKTFRARCRTCHRLPDPASRTVDQWAVFLDEHRDRAKLDESQAKEILTFLQRSR